MDLSGFNKPGFNIGSSQKTAPRAKAGGLKGTFENLLPAVGSIVGGVGGSLLAPGVGTAAGGAGGAVLGQRLKDKLTGSKTSGAGYAEQAALGTLGGVGKGLSAIRGGAQALRAGEGAGAAGSALRFGSKGAAAVGPSGGGGILSNAVIASNANAGKTLGGAVSKQAANIGKQGMMAQTGGLGKRTAESAVRDIGDLRTLGYTNFNKAAEHAPLITGENGILTQTRNAMLNSSKAKPVGTSEFLGHVQNIVDNHPLTPAEEKTIMGKVTKIANKYDFHGSDKGIGITSPANFNSAMKDIFTLGYNANRDSTVRKALVDLGNSMRPQLADSLSSVALDAGTKGKILGGLREAGVNNPQLIKAVRGAQTAADLSNIESKFVTASNVAKDAAESSLRGGVLGQGTKPTATGLINQLGGRAMEKTASKGGNIIENMIGKSKVESASSVPQVIGKTAKGSIKAQVAGRGLLAFSGAKQNQPADQPQPQGDNSQVADLLGLGGQVNPQDNSSSQTSSDLSGTPFTADNIQKAIMTDIAATGGKHISELTSLYSTFGSPKAQASSNLSTDEQKRVDNMRQASSTLQEYYNQLQSAGGGKGIAIGPAQSLLGKIGLGGKQAEQARALDATRIDIATSLAQAMTGNSRPAQQQITFWMHSIPNISDPQGVAKQKLQNIMGLINARTNALGVSP